MGRNFKTDVIILTDIKDLKLANKIKAYLEKEAYIVMINLKFSSECKKSLLNTSDIIILLSDDLINNYDFFEILDWILCLKRRYLILKTSTVDLSDFNLFLPLSKNLKFTSIDLTSPTFFEEIIVLLHSYQERYLLKINCFDRQKMEDEHCLLFLIYLIRLKIYKYYQIRMLINISMSEYFQYLKLFRKLLIIQKINHQVIIMKEEVFRQLFGHYYNRCLIKDLKYDNLSNIFKQLFLKVDKIIHILKNVSKADFNDYFEQIYYGYLHHTVVSNQLFDVFKLIKLIDCWDNSFSFNLPIKDVIRVKTFIKNSFIIKNDNRLSLQNIYINGLNSDLKVSSFKLYHEMLIGNVSLAMSDSTLMINLVSKDSVYNPTFLNKIHLGLNREMKMLFIYLDRCEFSLEMQYLIKDYPDICFWAYHTIDVFFVKYYQLINETIKQELLVNHRGGYVELK